MTPDEARARREDTCVAASCAARRPSARPQEPPPRAARLVTLADEKVSQPSQQRIYVILPYLHLAKTGEAEALEVAAPSARRRADEPALSQPVVEDVDRRPDLGFIISAPRSTTRASTCGACRQKTPRGSTTPRGRDRRNGAHARGGGDLARAKTRPRRCGVCAGHPVHAARHASAASGETLETVQYV